LTDQAASREELRLCSEPRHRHGWERFWKVELSTRRKKEHYPGSRKREGVEKMPDESHAKRRGRLKNGNPPCNPSGAPRARIYTRRTMGRSLANFLACPFLG